MSESVIWIGRASVTTRVIHERHRQMLRTIRHSRINKRHPSNVFIIHFSNRNVHRQRNTYAPNSRSSFLCASLLSFTVPFIAKLFSVWDYKTNKIESVHWARAKRVHTQPKIQQRNMSSSSTNSSSKKGGAGQLNIEQFKNYLLNYR